MKQILLGLVVFGASLALVGSAEARGPGGLGGRSGGGMSNMSAGVRNFNSGGATSARSFSPAGGFSGGNLSSRAMTANTGSFQNNISSRINRAPINSGAATNRVNNVGGGIGFNRDAAANKFMPKNGNTGVFGNSGKLNSKVLDPRVTTRPGDLFGKGKKLNDKVLDPRVTTRPGDLLGKGGKLNDKVLDSRVTTRPGDLFGRNGSKLGDVLGKNGKFKDVVSKNGRLNDVLKNGRLNNIVKNGRLSDKLNNKLSDKITSKLGKNFLKHAHHDHHHHHHHHSDWWCHQDFWCHNDYSCHSWYFDWCFPWYGPDWCWDYYPEVIIDTYPVYVSETVVVAAAATSVDLELVSVELLDVGEPAKKLGPRFLVIVRNVGTATVEEAIVRLAAGRELNPAAFEKPVEVTESIDVLVPGETFPVEIRLPLEAMSMNRTAEGNSAPFGALAAAVEPPQNLTDVNPENNFRLTPRQEIKLAGF